MIRPCAFCMALVLTAAAQNQEPAFPPDIRDAAYGSDPRQVMDVWLPDVRTGNVPCVLFIHGGGWLNGDKSDAVKKEKYVQALLSEGIAVAAINYRFMSQYPFPASMQDAARALQYLRSRAGEWGLDRQRIGLAGTSAGGCSALWLALSDEMADPQNPDPVLRESTRVSCVYVVKAQSTLDPEQMKEWTGNDLVFQHHMIKAAFGYPDRAKDPEGRLAGRYSPAAQVSPGDPPILFNAGGKETPPETTDQAIHHPGFALGLQKLAEQAGVPFLRAKDYQEYVGFFRTRLNAKGEEPQ